MECLEPRRKAGEGMCGTLAARPPVSLPALAHVLAHRNVTHGAVINRHAYELLFWKNWGVFALRSGVAPRAGARATPTGRELEQDDAVSGALVGEGRRGPRKRRKVEEDDEDWQRRLMKLHKSTNGLAFFFSIVTPLLQTNEKMGARGA